jgi:hypothetical protein
MTAAASDGIFSSFPVSIGNPTTRIRESIKYEPYFVIAAYIMRNSITTAIRTIPVKYLNAVRGGLDED